MSTMKIITKREALDRFIADRIMGNIPPARERDRCKYSKEVNGGCAIGVFLTKALYKPSMEGKTIATIFSESTTVRKRFEDWESAFWFYLQRAHDASSWEETEDYLLHCVRLC